MNDKKMYSVKEEIANAITHGLGAGLAIAGLVLLVVFAAGSSDPWRVVSGAVYGSALIVLYLASTLYHALPSPRVKRLFRVFDHSAIYILIAGTYTPFLLVSMRGPWGWSLFGVLWGITVVGIAFKFFCVGRWDRLSTALYVAMGWVALLALKPALTMIPVPAMIMAALGGLLYTAGVFFYMSERVSYNHAIWHLFVLGASTVQFFGVLLFLMCAPAV